MVLLESAGRGAWDKRFSFWRGSRAFFFSVEGRGSRAWLLCGGKRLTLRMAPRTGSLSAWASPWPDGAAGPALWPLLMRPQLRGRKPRFERLPRPIHRAGRPCRTGGPFCRILWTYQGPNQGGWRLDRGGAGSCVWPGPWPGPWDLPAAALGRALISAARGPRTCGSGHWAGTRSAPPPPPESAAAPGPSAATLPVRPATGPGSAGSGAISSTVTSTRPTWPANGGGVSRAVPTTLLKRA